uniref:Terpene synthase 17 n=1 Tax=Aquilaria sinensis TaxID=210372 RepID=A0A8E8E497_9ROSI|nr:terpene synthase 17 [Aquilaria sinensis]
MEGESRMLLQGKQFQNLHVKPAENGVSQHRRSANYKPNIWNFDLLQSLGGNYGCDGNDDYRRHVENLKEKLKVMFSEARGDEVVVLELVDSLRKMGLSSMFEEEIHKALQISATSGRYRSNPNAQQDLYVVALRFRLLRLHGCDVSQDVFFAFLDENGEFLESKRGDIKGLIELLEASYLATEGEEILDKAKAYAMRSLKTHPYSSCNDDHPSPDNDVVGHILELSSHWRVPWFDVKWQIETYEKYKLIDTNSVHFAKFHFNVVQASLQNDLRQLSMWWKSSNLMQHLGFARDRVVESFMCSMGLTIEPQFSFFRKCLTKAIVFVLLIDDIYDVYGSLDELSYFTAAAGYVFSRSWARMVNFGEQRGDIKGLIELLEASYLATEGEEILDKAKAYAMRSLKTHPYSSCNDDHPSPDNDVVGHILELSSH